jgi:hypothetical protein
MGTADLKTTAQKFRFSGLQQRFIQYNTLWSKVLKQIEEGTYRRDLFLLERKVAQEKSKPKIPAPQEKRPGSALDLVYEKMKQIASPDQKIPPKESFVAAVEKQLAVQRAKNPGKKIEIKLQKDSTGQVQVKLSLKKEPPA